MILVQIATALAIGAYAVLSKECPDATPRDSLRPTRSTPGRSKGLLTLRALLQPITLLLSEMEETSESAKDLVQRAPQRKLEA